MIPPTVAENSADAATLADQLVRARVLPPDRLTGLLADFPGGGPGELAEFLVTRKVLTPFQADRALAGEARVLALGPYQLTDLHRRGPFGPVLRGEKGGTAFAVRVLPLRSLWQARQAKLLARVLSALPLHPGVLPLVDADSAGGYHYLVWPLAAGEPLDDLVRAAGPLHPDQAAVLLAHLAAALAACHARQVVHGLLTPAAVAVGGHNAPRLLDLGAGALLARDLEVEEPLL
jgi:serine/threonine protein kinase